MEAVRARLSRTAHLRRPPSPRLRQRHPAHSCWPARRRRRTAAFSTCLFPHSRKRRATRSSSSRAGSGQAIENGTRGDVDALLVHSPAAEQKMIDAGDGIERQLVMHNDFLIVGPASDPAGVKSGAGCERCVRRNRGQAGGVHQPRRQLGHPRVRAEHLEIDQRHARRSELVQRDRPGPGRHAAGREPAGRICARRPRHVSCAEAQPRPRHPAREERRFS